MNDAISTGNAMGNVPIPVLTDEMVEVAAGVMYEQNWNRPTWAECIGEIERDKYRDKARYILEAALPPLLERVEAAEGEVARLTGITDGLCALCGDTRESANHLIGCPDLERALLECVDLAAKVAGAWDEGYDAAWDDSDTEHPIPEPTYRKNLNPHRSTPNPSSELPTHTPDVSTIRPDGNA